MTRSTNGKPDWNRFRNFHLEEQEPAEELCSYAQQLLTWADETCAAVLKNPSVLTINQAVLLLTHQYFSYRKVVPKAHRERINERGHVCIFHIFERAFWRLETERLRLDPPVLCVPADTPPANPLTPVPGVVIGEILSEL